MSGMPLCRTIGQPRAVARKAGHAIDRFVFILDQPGMRSREKNISLVFMTSAPSLDGIEPASTLRADKECLTVLLYQRDTPGKMVLL